MSSKYGSLSGCTEINPDQISISSLLTNDQATNEIRELCDGKQTFAGIFEYTNNSPVLVNGSRDNNKYPEADVYALIKHVKDTGQPQDVRLEPGLNAIGYPVWLNREKQAFLKGCFVFITPYINDDTSKTHLQIAHLIANLYTEKISNAFSNRAGSKNCKLSGQGQKLNHENLIDAINKSDLRMLLVDKDLRMLWQSSFMDNTYTNSAVGGYCYKVLHNRDCACEGCIAKRVFETGVVDTSIVKINTPGDQGTYKITSCPIMGENGEVVQVLQIAQDLAIPRSIQTQLGHYKRLIDQSEDYMVAIDAAGKLLAVNKKMADDLGYTAEEIIGSSFIGFIPQKGRENISGLIRGALKYGISIGTIRIKKKDGTNVIATGSLTHNKELGIYECVCRDISSKQRLDDELRERSEQLLEQNQKVVEAIQKRDHFLRSVSHELRSPLTAIMGFSELLMEDETEPLTKSQQRALERITKSTKRLLELVNDLLDLSKLDAEKARVDWTWIKLDTFIPQIVESMMPLAKDHGLDICVEVPQNFPKLKTDEAKLSQVVINLLSNAIKFTNEGHIKITARKTCSQFSIAVEDTGIGIPEDQLPNVFKEFHQIKQVKSKEGTGLGLAISHKLVSLLGGEISVSSKLGEGSVFTVYLPLAPKTTQ